jgi:hypothetical protein
VKTATAPEAGIEVGALTPVFSRETPYAVYRTTLAFRDKLLGGRPKDPAIIQKWLARTTGVTERQELARFAARVAAENGLDLGYTEEELALMEPEELEALLKEQSALLKQAGESYLEQSGSGFARDENGLYISDYQVKAALKEVTNILFAGERWGKTKKGPKSFVAERVHIRPQRIHLGRSEPHGVLQITGTPSGPTGKRNVVSHYEYVERPTVEFEVLVAQDAISQGRWALIWTLAGDNGIGAARNYGHGTFDVVGWERVKGYGG